MGYFKSKGEDARKKVAKWQDDYNIADVNLNLPHDALAHALPEPNNPPNADGELRGGVFEYVAQYYVENEGAFPSYEKAKLYGYARAVYIAKGTYGVVWLKEPEEETIKNWYEEAKKQVPKWFGD